jgi:DnaJ-class molecular chaperone
LRRAELDPYATLGLDRNCTAAQIRDAYRLLAKLHHPDVNAGGADAMARTQDLNAAHEMLSDPERRQAYDQTRNRKARPAAASRAGKAERNLAQEVHLRVEDFLRGASLEVKVNDPANPDGPETYPLVIPAETAPGARFRVPRAGHFAGGFITVRVRLLPGFRFKARGSDLRCELRIPAKRAAEGGPETVLGITGNRLRVQLPRGVGRGEILRLPGEGLPKASGGRGDLLVRISYRPEIRISRTAGR